MNKIVTSTTFYFDKEAIARDFAQMSDCCGNIACVATHYDGNGNINYYSVICTAQ